MKSAHLDVMTLSNGQKLWWFNTSLTEDEARRKKLNGFYRAQL
jgi:hypothetical protein